MATESRTSRAIRIAVFNFKGGVGKTTTALHLAATFAGERLMKKVGMVDWDPQCSLTQFFVDGTNVDIDDASSPREAEPIGLARFGDEPTINHIPLPSVQGHKMESYATATADNLNVDDFVKPYLCEVNKIKAETLVDTKTNNLVREVNSKGKFFSQRLWIVEGSAMLATREQDMAEECNKAKTRQRLAATLSERLLSGLERRCRFDVIIVDMSPSCSALNKAMAMSCDYILPPCDAELFSMGAVCGLYETVLPSWFEWRKAVVGNQASVKASAKASDSGDSYYYLSDDPPCVLPFLVNNFTEVDGFMFYHNAHFFNTLTNYLNGLKDNGMCDRRYAYKGQFAIPFMPRFKRLTSIAQDMGMPCEEITEEKYRHYYGFQKNLNKNSRKRKRDEKVEEMILDGKIEDLMYERKLAKQLLLEFGNWLLYVDNHRPKKTP